MLSLSLFLSFVLVSVISSSAYVVYDLFAGTPVSSAEIQRHIKYNTTFWCIKEIEPCNPKEFRRIDGTCNNLKNPARGAKHTPVFTILPAVYDKGFKPRLAEDGNPLPSCRPVRTNLVPEGYLQDTKFTQLLTYAMVFITSDVVAFHDTVQYIIWKPYCCGPKGKLDPACAPIKVPDDDPVHRFSDIRCMNLTVPETFQSAGCLKKDTMPEQIISNTPLFDLSHVYGNTLRSLYEKGRLFVGGLLKYEIENGKIWPPSTRTKVDLCLANQKPHETRCHDTPEGGVNSLLGLNLFLIWTWRLHNLIATNLYILNTCWDDEKIFYVTRDIVIAIYHQITYYEMWPLLMGRENLIRDSVISSSLGFRDLYNENIIPALASEFTTVLRWGHMIQNMNIRMYDTDGNYLKNVKMANLTLRTGYLVDNIDYITQSAFRQPSGKVKDHIVDWDMAEAGLYPHQKASDTLSADLCKSRLLGHQPYVAYREYCSGKSYETFDDLVDSFEPEQLELLKNQFGHPRDIDLPPALWLEKFIPGGHVPLTFYCVIVEQLIHNIVSDRHWYERKDRPNAFTSDQLLSIRNMTVARFMCDVGDSVTRIQPNAFVLPGPGNEICSCDKIQKLDLRPWKDPTCGSKRRGTYYQE